MRNVGIEYPARGEMAFRDIGEPEAPPPDHILLRTLYSGVTNGTERHALMAKHGWQHFPGRHGYQHVARVDAVGERVESFGVGDVVFCGQYVGHRAWLMVDAGGDRYGAPNHLTIKLPAGEDAKRCALLGVAGVGTRCIRRTRVSLGQNVWVCGLGMIGQFAAQAARACGARVTVTDVNERRLAVARELGAHDVLDARDPASEAAIKAGGPYDVIVDCSGSVGILPQIARDGLIAHHGAIALLAVRSETTFTWSMMHGTEASIEVSCHFDIDDLRVLLQLIEQGVVRIEPLISHVVPIVEAPSIYATMRDDPSSLLGVIFDWRVK
jgi:2-desacetyl-2-hydroxyethyl bacteriochlorophyllide A dehydrogenase